MGKPESKLKETIIVNQAAEGSVENHQSWHTIRAEAGFALAVVASAFVVGYMLFRHCRKGMHRYVQASVAEHLVVGKGLYAM